MPGTFGDNLGHRLPYWRLNNALGELGKAPPGTYGVLPITMTLTIGRDSNLYKYSINRGYDHRVTGEGFLGPPSDTQQPPVRQSAAHPLAGFANNGGASLRNLPARLGHLPQKVCKSI